MSISTPFIQRPVATSLLTVALALSGLLAFRFLPVSPLPQVEFPTIQVSAGLPGASPETMASAVATPLERQFGRISGVTEMTSSSTLGSTSITLQFDLNRNIDAAARDVQAAINAARGQLPANLPNNPTYRKINPADSPIMILALTSETMEISRLYDVAATILQQKLSQVEGVGQVHVGRKFVTGSPSRAESERAAQVWNRFGSSPSGAECSQREPAQGTTGGRQNFLGNQHDGSAPSSRTLPTLDCGLPAWGCGEAFRCR